MDRRNFTKGILLSGVASPFVIGTEPAWATYLRDDTIKGGEGGGISNLARIQLTIGASIIVVSFLVMLLANGPFGYNLNTPVRRYKADRVNTSNIPILGDLTRNTLASYFARSPIIGNLYLINSMLVLAPLVANLQRPKNTIVTHREWEYALPSAPKPVKLATPLTAEQFRNTNPVGKAVMKEGEMLLLVPPHVKISGV